jgi:small-conductance mechanosensitive channel
MASVRHFAVAQQLLIRPFPKLLRGIISNRFCVVFGKQSVTALGLSQFLQRSLTALLTTCLVMLFCGLAIAQSPPTENSGIPVRLDGQTVLIIRDRNLTSSVQQRAERIEKRLIDVANSSIQLENIHAEDIVLLTVSDQDAKLMGQDRQTLAKAYLEKIRLLVGQYRQQRSLVATTRTIVIALLSTLALLISWVILNNLAPRCYRWLDRQRNQRIPSLRLQNLELISSDQLSDLLLGLTSLLRWLLSFNLLYFYFSFVFSLFPQTRVFGDTMSSYLQNGLNASWTAFLGYFPNLIAIGLIVAIAYFCLRFLKLIFSGISRQVFSVSGFYPEWAEPTYKLLTYLVFALTAAIVFPYLPGSSSPAFQGVSLFLGALVSLGATSAVSNIVAGFVLVYTRAFQVSDRVKIADVLGVVEEKLLLVTRIRTLNNVLVTIPNSVLLTSNIINYSALLRDGQIPLILSTTITLGYDLPWRLVHETLVAAALATPDILSDPAPFVLQTALNDFYISYELKACTRNPELMPAIYSALHQNIQDKCNQAGIEICSPHYAAIRDGNQNTIPAHYLPKDYNAPGFRVTSVNNSSASQTPDSDPTPE